MMIGSSVKNANMTKEQMECVNFNSGDLLVSGVAGSGKSYVILKRAAKLYRDYGNTKSIKIFTYTNSLVHYTDELISEGLGTDSVEVSTVDKYCFDLYKKLSGKYFRAISSSERAKIAEETITEYARKSAKDHRFFKVAVEYWIEEFGWIREKCIKTKKQYFEADRKGRGTQVKVYASDKEVIWGMYLLYMEKLRLNRKMDWPDLYVYLNDNLHRIPRAYKIDYILVDEAQDMTLGKLKVLGALRNESLTIAADVAQKIYKTSFTWKETGIDISGRSSKKLNKSFRSTKQIVTLAEDVMAINRVKSNLRDEYTEAVMPEKEGLLPTLFRCKSVSEEQILLTKLLKGLTEDNARTIGIITRNDKDNSKMSNFLNSAGIDNQIIDKKKEWTLLEGGVKIVTAHSSKGLEFDDVIIYNFNDSKYPIIPRHIENDQIDEHVSIERSILYVAMTRARETLTLICIKASASRFISEFKKEHYIDKTT